MFPYIVKQKQEGSKKIIILRLKFGIIEKVCTFIFFVFIFLSLIKFDDFSSVGKAEYIIFAPFAIFIIIFWILTIYKAEVRITKDISTGSLTIERGVFKLWSYVFKKEEKPNIKLTVDLRAYWPFLKIKTWIPMIISDRTRIRMEPGLLGETRLTKWYRYRLFLDNYHFNNRWTFTEKDIKNIADYLEIPIDPEKGKFVDLEMKECYERDVSSIKKGKI